jgi:hypothetical protein
MITPKTITGAGDLRYSVGFYQRSALSNSPPDYGNTEDNFPSTAIFTTPANITPKLGGEDVLAARLTGKNLVNITVRQSANTALVTTDWLAKDERSGDEYNIRSVIDPDGGTSRHGFYFEMLCEKGVAI